MKSKNAKSSKEKYKQKENENNKKEIKENNKIFSKLISKIDRKRLLLNHFQIWAEIRGNDKIFMYNGIKALDIIENSQSEISLTQIEQNKLNKKNDNGKKESNNINNRSNDNSLMDDLNKMKSDNHPKREPKHRSKQKKENKLRKTSYSSKNSVNKELKNNIYEDEFEDKSSSGKALALKNKKVKNISKTKNKKETNSINPEYQNIINRHNKDKSLRYKNYLFKIKRTLEIDRLSLTNIKSEILAEKNNKKLMNIVNIKKCHEDKLMNYFDKWFEKTYMPEKKHKKVVKKIKKKKHVDKKLSDIDDTKNEITSSNEKNSDFKDKTDDSQVKSFKLEDPFKKMMKKKKNSKKNKKLNLTMQLSSGNIHKKSYKKIIKTSFDMKDNDEMSRRNSQHFKIRNPFNGLNKTNNEEEINKKYKYKIIRGIYILSKIFKDHQMSNEKNPFKKWIIQTFDKMKETKMKKAGDIPKKNSSENSIKHRKKNGKKHSGKLKLKKVIDMVTQSKNHNSKITYFNKWKNNNLLDETFQTFGKELSNKNEDSEELNQKYKSIKNEQAINSKLNDIIIKKIIKINNIKKAYLEKWINNKNLGKASKNTIEEENSSVTMSSNLSNINKKDDESSFSGYIIDYAKNNMLREININKLNKVVQNKVEKQEKCFLKIVNKPNNNNNLADDNHKTKSIEEDKDKQIKTNEGDKHSLGQISMKAQPPSQIKGGLPPQKTNNLGQISSKAQAPVQVKGGLPNQKTNNLGQISSKAQAPSQVKGGLPPQKTNNLGQISSKAQAPSQVKGGLPPQKNNNFGQISSKAQAPSQVKGGLPPQNNNKTNNNMISEKPNKIIKKEFLEQDEEDDYTINNDLTKKDFFEEELRNSVFKNLAINDFRGTVIKKAENNNMDNYNNINNDKHINDNMINRHKDDNSNFLKEKQKIQPPKQVLEFNAKKNNNNEVEENNNNRINIRNRYQKEEQMKNKDNPKTRERKINRYYYRSKERKRDKKREKIQKENNEQQKIIPNNVKEMDFSPNKNKNYNNHRNIRNKKRAKLSYVISKIDSSRFRNFFFKKWKDLCNEVEKSEFVEESEEIKKYKKEEEISSQNNVESELILDSVDSNYEGKKIDNQFEKEKNSGKNNIIKHKNNDNKSNTEDNNSFHSEITENDYKENRQKYNIINEMTAKSKKILNINLNFLQKDKNNSHTFDIYLSLLIKNCKAMAAYRIFCLYSSFNKNIDILRIRKVLNIWKKGNRNNSSDNNNSDSNSNSNSNNNSNSNSNSNNESNNL